MTREIYIVCFDFYWFLFCYSMLVWLGNFYEGKMSFFIYCYKLVLFDVLNVNERTIFDLKKQIFFKFIPNRLLLLFLWIYFLVTNKLLFSIKDVRKFVSFSWTLLSMNTCKELRRCLAKMNYLAFETKFLFIIFNIVNINRVLVC